MKKATVILGIFFVLILSTTIYVAIKKYKPKPEEPKPVEVTVGGINLNLQDLDNIKKSNSKNYNIEILNNVEKYIKENIDFDKLDINESKTIDSNLIVKDTNCSGTVKVYKLINGIYSVDINSSCKTEDEQANKFSFKLLGNLNNNGKLYFMEELESGILAASYKTNGSKTVSNSIIKFNKDLNIEWIYDIDYTKFNLREEDGMKVMNIIEHNDNYYVIGYLNDDFGSVFGIKFDKNGEVIWEKIISQEMFISDVIVIDNKVVIVDDYRLNFLTKGGNIEETILLDLKNSKLKEFKLGSSIYYDKSIYGYNIAKNEIAKFNSEGLLDTLYTFESPDSYLEKMYSYDNKLFFTYEDGTILVMDVFGRYIGKVNKDEIYRLVLNNKDFNVINYQDNYYKLDVYKYDLSLSKTYEILGLSHKSNIFVTDNQFYQYLCDNNYIVFAKFDK